MPLINDNYTPSNQAPVIQQPEEDTQPPSPSIDEGTATIAKQFLEPDVDSARLITVPSNITAMKQYLDGYTWTVTYYSMIASSDDRLTTLDNETALNNSQGVIKVHNLHLKLTTPITNTNYDDISGTALIDKVLTPRVGDMLKAPLLDGSDALFMIIGVKDVSYNKDRYYEVEFKFDTNRDLDAGRFTIIEDRVIRHVYATDLDNGGGVIYDQGAMDWRLELKEFALGVPNLYSNFYRNGYAVLDTEAGNIYDPYVTELYNAITPERSTMHRESGVDIYKTQLAILAGDFTSLRFKLSRASVIEVNSRVGNPTNENGLLPSDIDFIVQVEADGEWYADNVACTLPKPADYDSAPFYLYEIDGTSTLEVLLKHISKREALPRLLMRKLLDDIVFWTKPEKYYYVPLALGIILYELKNLHQRGVDYV